MADGGSPADVARRIEERVRGELAEWVATKVR
jgi:hypothetical protein